MILKSLEEKTAFAQIMADPERAGLSVKEIAEKFCMSIATIYATMKDPEIAKLIKAGRADYVKIDMPAIDKAMVKKALAGSEKAAELIYARWDDYVPRNRVDNANLNANSAEEEKARKEKIKKFMGEVLDSKPEPVVSAPVPVPVVSEDKKV